MAGSLPCESTSFVGRSAELAGVARLLADPGCRLLTLLGSGGIGKTQLALAVAAAHTATFADGVAFVALASVGSPDQIVSAIGESLQLDFASQPDPTTHLLGELRERTPLIVERRERQLRLPHDLSRHCPASRTCSTMCCATCRDRGIMSPITLRHWCTTTNSRYASTLCRVIGAVSP